MWATSFKIDLYLKSLSDACEIISSHTIYGIVNNTNKSKCDSKQGNINNEHQSSRTVETNKSATESTETSYLQTEIIPGTDGRTILNRTCYNYGKCWHYANNCPELSCHQPF